MTTKKLKAKFGMFQKPLDTVMEVKRKTFSTQTI